MALNQTNKLVWILETIYRAHKISFEELNRHRMDNVDSWRRGDVEAYLPQVKYLRHLWLVDRMRKDSSLFNKANQ